MSRNLIVLVLVCSTLSTVTIADETLRADSHAPIGVMGDHFHKKGEWMLSYRFMHMAMAGNQLGKDNISADEIATTQSNRFFGLPMQPPTLRVVPTEMTMDMHMLGLMYAPSDRVTLMAMLNYIEKDMDHLTFQGPMGTQRLGTFTTKTSGVGDSRLAALIKLQETSDYRVHVTVGFSLPTGAIDERGVVLAPTGMQSELRLPYPMQLGSGTYDFVAGLTYTRFYDQSSWGAQWQSLIRMGENDDNYTLGDEHRLSGWFSYLFRQGVSGSVRLEAYDRGNIDGIDPLIRAPVQTADPSRQGIKRVDLGIGLNLAGTEESLQGHRVGLELLFPVYQNLDGPQLETDWQATIGYQYSF